MKKSSLKITGGILGAALVAMLASCDGGSSAKPAGTVTPKPPVPEGQKIKAPGPPPMGGESFQKTEKPAEKPKSGG